MSLRTTSGARARALVASLLRHGVVLPALALCVLVSGRPAAAGAAPQDETPRARIAARIDGLKQRLAELSSTGNAALGGYVRGLVDQLDAAAAANETGLTYAALGVIRQVEPGVVGVTLYTEHSAEVDTPEEHAALADSLAARLAGRLDAARARDWGRRPLAVRAMAQGSAARVESLLDGGRAFGVGAADYQSGLLYLGFAEGNLDFAEWLATLPLASGAPAAEFPGLEAEVARLDRAVLGAYQDPEAQVDRHPAFIAASSGLKLAGQLLADGERLGALLSYLDAVRAFADATGAAEPAPTLDALNTLDFDLSHRLFEAGVDHSIGALYLELARRRLETAAREEPEAAASTLAGAAVLLREVLPRYLDVVAGEAVADAPAVMPDVTVTLVRWPFT